jgi:YbgC/YbaW family acyl-CoA thioester hydrolase
LSFAEQMPFLQLIGFQAMRKPLRGLRNCGTSVNSDAEKGLAFSFAHPSCCRFACRMEPREYPTIQTEHPVMFFDTDCAGVVHNLAYLRFIETARTLLAEQLGMPLAGMADRGVYPVLLATDVRYHRTARLGDIVVVDGVLDSVSRTRFWVRFTLTVKSSVATSPLVTCRQALCLVQMPGPRPIRLPAHWPVRFGHLSGDAENL